MKRFLTLVLACAMLLAVLPVAAEEVTYKTLYSGEVTTLNYLTTTTTNEFGLAANLVDTGETTVMVRSNPPLLKSGSKAKMA